MAAITQMRGSFPFTGRRYGSFANKVSPIDPELPNFMRGSLRVVPHVGGDIRVVSAFFGEITVNNTLGGKIETNP